MSLLVTASFTLCWMPYIIGYMLNSFSQISNLTEWLAGNSPAQADAAPDLTNALPNVSSFAYAKLNSSNNFTLPAANLSSESNYSNPITSTEHPLDVGAYVLGWSDVISSFATLNSLINPMIYAMFHLRRRSRRQPLPPVSVVAATFHRTSMPAHHLNSAHVGNGNNTCAGNTGAHRVSSNNNLNNNPSNNNNNTNQSSLSNSSTRYDG